MGYQNHDYVVDQLRDAGLEIELPLELARNEKSVRCRVAGGDHEKRGWYRLYEHLIDGDLYLVGSYGIFHGDDPGTRKIDLTRRCDKCGATVPLRDKKCPACGSTKIRRAELSDEQKAALAARLASDKKRAAAERQAELDRASQWAAAVWRASTPVDRPDDHDYLPRKHLAAAGGARIFPGNDGVQLVGAEADDYKYLAGFAGALVVPIMDAAGRIYSLQFILSRKAHGERIRRTERDKEYWPGGDGTIKGHYYLIGPSPAGAVLIAEGFATAMTLHQASGLPVAVAFAANNIGPVTAALKKHYRRARPLICADDDWLQTCAVCKAWTPVGDGTCAACGQPHKKLNAGVQRAAEAALAAGCSWIKPEFSEPRPTNRKGPTDFNDLAGLEGEAVVRAQIEKALAELKIAPGPAAAPEKSASENAAKQGGGERRRAESVMTVDDLVERYVPLDDGTGDYVFDTWTNKVTKRSQMLTLLPAGARGDDIKRHPVWISRGAFFMDEVGFDPSCKNTRIKLNTWQGWPLKPERGTCDNILDHLRFLSSMEDNADEVYNFILDYLAYPLQNPGSKLASAMIFHGDQGSGKSIIFDTVMSKIYGAAFKKISQRRIENQFTDWARNRLFVVIEEISASSDVWHVKGEFKDMVTSDTFDINDKNEKWVEQANMINFVLLSNEQMPIPLEAGDRRHLVVFTPPKPSDAYIANLARALDDETPCFYDFLLTRDLSGFHRHKRPPMTRSKQRLINISLPSEAVFINEWIDGQVEYNGEVVPFCPCLGTDLYAVYAHWSKKHNIARPRDLAKFIGYISSLPTWDAGKPQATYERLDSATKKNRKMVVPGPDAFQRASISSLQSDAGILHQRNDTKGVWLTSGYFKFRNAMGVSS